MIARSIRAASIRSGSDLRFRETVSTHVDSPAHELTRICAAAVIFIKGVSPSRLLSVALGNAINITALQRERCSSIVSTAILVVIFMRQVQIVKEN